MNTSGRTEGLNLVNICLTITHTASKSLQRKKSHVKQRTWKVMNTDTKRRIPEG